MAFFNPPRELNGTPLSERSRFLLYWPVEWLLNPAAMAQPVSIGDVTIFQRRLWFVDDQPKSFKSRMTDDVFRWS